MGLNRQKPLLQLALSFMQLRVLDLSNTGIKKLPRSIGKLKHLRYLDLSRSCIETLPTSICSLRNMQTIKLMGIENLRMLPKDLRKMISLRSLEFDTWSVAQMPWRIGQLSGLQTLTMFVVGQERGRTITELQGLNLQGEITIYRLENVKNASDAKKANLKDKRNLCSLSLSWDDISDANLEQEVEAVLEGLQPHPNLKDLSVWKYIGTKMPS